MPAQGFPQVQPARFNTPNGSLSGTCSLVPTGEVACVPENGLPNGNQGPLPAGGGQP